MFKFSFYVLERTDGVVYNRLYSSHPSPHQGPVPDLSESGVPGSTIGKTVAEEVGVLLLTGRRSKGRPTSVEWELGPVQCVDLDTQPYSLNRADGSGRVLDSTCLAETLSPNP